MWKLGNFSFTLILRENKFGENRVSNWFHVKSGCQKSPEISTHWRLPFMYIPQAYHTSLFKEREVKYWMFWNVYLAPFLRFTYYVHQTKDFPPHFSPTTVKPCCLWPRSETFSYDYLSFFVCTFFLGALTKQHRRTKINVFNSLQNGYYVFVWRRGHGAVIMLLNVITFQ